MTDFPEKLIPRQPKTNQPKKKWGGKREGAGPKPKDPDSPLTETICFRVEPELKKFADKQPEGASAYMRSLLLRAEINSRIL